MSADCPWCQNIDTLRPAGEWVVSHGVARVIYRCRECGTPIVLSDGEANSAITNAHFQGQK